MNDRFVSIHLYSSIHTILRFEMMKSSSSSRRRLGQIVCGPPGAGKSTYCDGMSQFFNAIGRKSTFIINLDPASVGNAASYGTFKTLRISCLSLRIIVLIIQTYQCRSGCS
ncbi:ATP/GTP-binding protein [bacterium]|nr:ATP/GTP-binding protein [bacterium]